MKYLSIILSIIFATGCSTHMTKVVYEGDGIQQQVIVKVIKGVSVSDNRGTDGNWLGAIRGGYGNRLKTLRTDQSTDVVVQKMYLDALEKSSLLSDVSGAPFTLKVVITKFDCSYYFNREAHAYLDVSLIDSSSSNITFTKTYKTDEVESGVGAGVFGSVETLRDLAETAMNKTIDKTLSDPEFLNALSHPSINTTSERLRKIDELYQNDVINKEEYE